MSALDPTIWADLIGKPFRFRGRGPDHYDCYGLLLVLFRRRGIIIADFAYQDDPQANTSIFAGGIKASWRPCEVRAGAALAFRRLKLGVGHCGVAIDSDRFIHATEDFKQVMVSRLSARSPIPYKAYLQGAYDYAV